MLDLCPIFHESLVPQTVQDMYCPLGSGFRYVYLLTHLGTLALQIDQVDQVFPRYLGTLIPLVDQVYLLIHLGNFLHYLGTQILQVDQVFPHYLGILILLADQVYLLTQ